jgi:release factor glutamine methyltransferase
MFEDDEPGQVDISRSTVALDTGLSAEPVSWQTWLAAAADQLRQVSTDPMQTARWLLMAAVDCTATQLFLTPNRLLMAAEAQRLHHQIHALCEGQPLAYVLGQWSFCGLPVRVTQDTLIPRPETEGMVEAVLARLSEQAVNATGGKDASERQALSGAAELNLLDLGTGSGAIALALAKALPRAQIYATDRSSAALRVARQNAEALALGNIQWLCMDWCTALSDRTHFDVIVSNPPYLRSDDPHLSTSIRYEPLGALVSGPSGLEAVEAIAAGASQCLRQGGQLFIEHGYDQGPSARSILTAVGFRQVETFKDLSGQDRIVFGTWIS